MLFKREGHEDAQRERRRRLFDPIVFPSTDYRCYVVIVPVAVTVIGDHRRRHRRHRFFHRYCHLFAIVAH